MTNYLDWVLERLHAYRLTILVPIHIVLITAANQAAFWLRFDGDIPAAQQPFDTELLPLLIAVRFAVFFPMRLHQGVWRYASILDLRNIVIGVSLSSVIFWAVIAGVLEVGAYPRSIFIIDGIILICLMGGLRLARRLHSVSLTRRDGRRVLIYGAGDAGEMIVRDMLHNANLQVWPVGFIDDDGRKVGQRIHGVPVLGSRQELPDILKAYAAEELLIAIPSAPRETLRAIVRVVEQYKIRITTLPRLHNTVGARVEADQIRQLKVEDLLARDPVGLDHEPIHRFLARKRVVVTGAGGSIGSELCRQIAATGAESLMLLERYENSLFHTSNEIAAAFPHVILHTAIADVTDEKRIEQLFGAYRPHIVFHAAAHKHVPLMEENPCEAVKNNVAGTRIVAESALRHGVDRFVLISTDKAVNPTSVMGATKRVAELIVSGLSRRKTTRFASVRFGNVLGSNGSVVPTFLEQIAKGGPVTVTHPEMKRFFMLIPEAVQLVLHAGALADQAPLFVLEMGEQVRVVDMARDLIRLSGYVPDKDIAIEFTGMRPGEKLFEELVGAAEFAEPSSLDKILKVQAVAGTRLTEMAPAIARLEALAFEGSSDELLVELQNVLTQSTARRGGSTVAI